MRMADRCNEEEAEFSTSGSTDSKKEKVETMDLALTSDSLKSTSSCPLLPKRPHLLQGPHLLMPLKKCHSLMNKHSNVWIYEGYPNSNYHIPLLGLHRFVAISY